MGIIDDDQLSAAMKWLKKVKTDMPNRSDEPSIPVVREMFKEYRQEPKGSEAEVPHVDKESSPYYINRRLARSQRKAVKLALRDQPLTVIHGPPGTGKTTTIVEVILQHVERGQRVLVCAPSNKAVDNLLESLGEQTAKAGCLLSMTDVLRHGHPARMDEKHTQFSPQVQLKKRMKMIKHKRLSPAQLHKLRQIEMARLLRDASVVMSTLTSVCSAELDRTFDLLVIDECGQATEAACWLAIPHARKVLLAGDPLQLPPTILSQEAARRGLAVSLMERQMELHGEGVVHLLDTQYRMHKLIQAWSSRTLYHGQLKAAPEVRNRLLIELPGVRSTKQTQPTLLLVDTDGCKLEESKDDKTTSFRNHGEANLVVTHAKYLVEAGVPAKDIGVITPYKQQVALIDRKMRAAGLDVEVNSVDGYQGREKEAILLSLVRSNRRGQVGFVGDRRRLNVAVTRAHRHLFIVCDTATVCRDYTIKSLVEHMERSGESRSAYCNRCPRGKDGYSAEDSDDGDADSISKLSASLGAMKLKRQEWGSRENPRAAYERRPRVAVAGSSFPKRQPAAPRRTTTNRLSSTNNYQRQAPVRWNATSSNKLRKARTSLRKVNSGAGFDASEEYQASCFDDDW